MNWKGAARLPTVVNAKNIIGMKEKMTEQEHYAYGL